MLLSLLPPAPPELPLSRAFSARATLLRLHGAFAPPSKLEVGHAVAYELVGAPLMRACRPLLRRHPGDDQLHHRRAEEQVDELRIELSSPPLEQHARRFRN